MIMKLLLTFKKNMVIARGYFNCKYMENPGGKQLRYCVNKNIYITINRIQIKI